MGCTLSPNLEAGSDTVDWCGHMDSAAPLVAYMDMKPSERLNISHRQTVYLLYTNINL